jgi:hypothetical protein
MDPYIEACGLREDFHTHLIEHIAAALADAAPERYLVRARERSYVALVESEGKATRASLPDVSISGPRPRKRATSRKGGSAVAEHGAGEEAISMRAFIEEAHREAFVEIYLVEPRQRLVTSVEVLSPANKRQGTPGWELYLRKRQSVMLGGANLVEIDLLRGGQRMPMLDEWPDWDYTLLVARAYLEHSCRVFRGQLQHRLPPIPVPLSKPDPDLILDLQPMVDSIYERFRYGRSIDYRQPLTPPLRPNDAAWLKQKLRHRPA